MEAILPHFFSALGMLLNPNMILILLLGVVGGIFLGVLPGIGGTAALAILFPLTYKMSIGEGILFLLAVIIARAIIMIRVIGIKGYLREILYFISGGVLVLVILAYFKFYLVPVNGLFAAQETSELIGKLFDWSRYKIVFVKFAKQLLFFGKGIIFVLIICSIIIGIKKENYKQNGFKFLVTVILLMLGGYFYIYIITPQDLEWHMRTSLDRILMHLYPLTLLSINLLLGRKDIDK